MRNDQGSSGLLEGIDLGTTGSSKRGRRRVPGRAVIAGVLVVVAAGVLAWRIFGGGPGVVADSVTLLNIRTGEREKVSRTSEKAKLLPAYTDEGERILYPIVRRDGKWMIDPHFQPHFADNFKGSSDLVVDASTFEVID